MTTVVKVQKPETGVSSMEDKPDPVEAIQQYVSQNKPVIGRLVSGEFEITTLNEAEKLSTMLAANTPFPEKASLGIWELLSNAVEHGNLEIDQQTKAELVMSGKIEDEIRRRLQSGSYRDRVVRVFFKCSGSHVWLKVQDEGKGFDFEKVLNSEMPLDQPNGRGILVARNLCFDTIEYHGCGNEVVATIRL
ncbi:ATP-binding protein [uncultured Roseibium sp.]|uniref:ATP-binding protein n=1 Tax=uncultured Roseibium sp. TaxID=1936171 RepID=UPI003217303A